MIENTPVLIKGAGDLATGVAARLWRSGFPVVMTELAQPLTIRRTVAFAEAVYTGEVCVEGILARHVPALEATQSTGQADFIPILTGCTVDCIAAIRPVVLVDAILAKRNTGTSLQDAPFVIGLGPGFEVNRDVHAVVETNRGHFLGRVLWSGSAQPDTGIPGEIIGMSRERIIYAPSNGAFEHQVKIGSLVNAGDIVGYIRKTAVTAPVSGVLRGLIHDGLPVQKGLKIGDVDPRAAPHHCWTISDKALAIGGGVLEAILMYLRGEG
jgi:xanthine dehydrogenase accessory factor